MATSRKKQDEKNLKVLRELASLPHNKYCFDCNQRGPTYVNVTIGSFVCTKCSGLLRGLTPPHRVKSISMATFTLEEVELLKNRGNSYCKRVWLGLYEGDVPEHRDEHVIRDFMVDKYDHKRYYLEPTIGNETSVKNNVTNVESAEPAPEIRLVRKPVVKAKKNLPTTHTNGNDFIADFGSADIYNAMDSNRNNSFQTVFANFDNNPLFNSNDTKGKLAPPPEDRYAALKDLDNAFKSQTVFDWNSSSSGSVNSTGSLQMSSSPPSSLQESPSDVYFGLNTSLGKNPFNSNTLWNLSNGEVPNNTINPFQTVFSAPNHLEPFSQSNSTVNSSPWMPNPFVRGTTTPNGNSTNPFL